jgi:hypothetical protein
MIIRNITMIKKVAGIININESKFLSLQNKLKFVDHNIKGVFIVFNPTFNNISVTCISCRSVLLLKGTGVPGEDHRLAASQ